MARYTYNPFTSKLDIVSTGGFNSTPIYTVVARTTGVLSNSPTYSNGTGGIGATLTATVNGALPAQDGVPINNFDFILVADQANQAHNGIYLVLNTGSAGTPYVLERADFGNETPELFPLIVDVSGGTINANKLFSQSTENPVIGTDNLIFEEIAAAPIVSTNVIRGRTITVDRLAPSSTDVRTGLNKYDMTNPFRTIQAAVNAAITGDTIEIAAGVYTENVTITNKHLYINVRTGVTIVNAVSSNPTFSVISSLAGAYFILTGTAARDCALRSLGTGAVLSINFTSTANTTVYVRNLYIFRFSNSAGNTILINNPNGGFQFAEFKDCIISRYTNVGGTINNIRAIGATLNLNLIDCFLFNDLGVGTGVCISADNSVNLNRTGVTSHGSDNAITITSAALGSIVLRDCNVGAETGNGVSVSGLTASVTCINTPISMSSGTNILISANSASTTAVTLNISNSSLVKTSNTSLITVTNSNGSGKTTGTIRHSILSQPSSAGKSLTCLSATGGSLTGYNVAARGTLDLTTAIACNPSVAI